MNQPTISKKEFLEVLRGTHEQQGLEQYAYYARKVSTGEITFNEEERVQAFYDFIDNHYSDPVVDREELKQVAEENGFVYLDDNGLEVISLLKEYNPVRYVQLGNQKKLRKWAWELSDNRKERFSELKGTTGFDTVGEAYLDELVAMIKSDYYFQEAPSEIYFNELNIRSYETPREALFHEFMMGELFSNDELDELTDNFDTERFDKGFITPNVREFLDQTKDHRQWLLENKETIRLFNEPVLDFVKSLDTIDFD